MFYCYILAVKHNYPRNSPMPMMKRIKVTGHALPALTVPLIILFGVSGGLFTVTESAAIAVVVSLILALVVYRTIKFCELSSIFASSAVTSCVSLFMMSIAGCCAWLVGYLNIPAMITDLVLSVTTNPHGIMLLLAAVLFILGMLLNPATIIVAFMPVMLALGEAAHVHPLHLGIICNFGVGRYYAPLRYVFAAGRADRRNFSDESILGNASNADSSYSGYCYRHLFSRNVPFPA